MLETVKEFFAVSHQYTSQVNEPGQGGQVKVGVEEEDYRQLHKIENILPPQLSGGFTGIHFIIMPHNFQVFFLNIKIDIITY